MLHSCWSGRNGEIFAVSLNSDVHDVKMRWYSPAYKRRIWILGDSYLNAVSPLRWPSYLVKDGYTNFLMAGFPGRDCHAALEDLKTALTHGTPEYIVWSMGMNNSDNPDSINQCFLRTAKELAEICRERGINLILSTIPCVPERYNSFKNEWVRNSGYRYVDFAAAVGAESEGSDWYEGMLSPDRVHPSAPGAKALYARFIADFPEILNK